MYQSPLQLDARGRLTRAGRALPVLWILTREVTPVASVSDALIERVLALGGDTPILRMTRIE
ncbi:hypothetical protein RI103_26320 [Paraburkholderia sp. FT54]|uniref:hypothetical protein n=1 Tax=Paraburkholderia sp. FT54 TaxID=3074437 RepID=UPI0028773D22|nr:hypothetical protein [Paraburkholderia sp. FT54]WNC91815.1 hypothetical protein RI103_26320 [Paraburkholderia sp. FT54]